MFRILFLSFCFYNTIFANFEENSFIAKNLSILEEFDINSEYFYDTEFQNYYRDFSSNYQERYTNHLDNAQIYIPEIKNILKENRLPKVFLYLAMAESNFVLEAKSYKKAIGLWQFMASTGELYNLRKNDYIDERMDFVKSTYAAVEHLQRLHKIFDKWYLTAIAYNCGEARVIEGITRATLDMYCEDNDCKNDQTIKTYRKVIKDYQRKKIKFNSLYKIYKTVKKWDYTPEVEELLIVQKGLRRQYIPNESRNYLRKILSLSMMNNSNELLKEENKHLLNSGIASPIATVRVKGGILLKNLADVMGITKKELKELNPHIKRNLTPPDENEYNLHIPYSKLATFKQNIEHIKPNQFISYKVKKGDTLGNIGAKFKINYKLIKKYNNLKSNILSINQHLIIPVDPDTYKKPKNYYVKSGDTLGKIARDFGVSIGKIKQDNYLKNSIIQVGEKLVINFE
jgi:membrane-bound lytic murein transglycosylase D